MNCVKELASFFDDPAKAEREISAHLNGDEIIRDDGTISMLSDFFENHKAAHNRRVAHNVPHKLEILKLDLSGSSSRLGTVCSSGIRPPDLDDMEQRRTEPIYVYSARHARH